MRPLNQNIGVVTSVAPTLVGPNGINFFDTSQLTNVSFQLVVTNGTWSAGTVALQASLDSGATWWPITGLSALSAPGWYAAPLNALGRVRAVATSLTAGATVAVWVCGLDSRTDL